MFAATLPEHNVNAKKYSDWINSQGVKDSFENYFWLYIFISSRFFKLALAKVNHIIFQTF
jgi:hypothetical protein